MAGSLAGKLDRRGAWALALAGAALLAGCRTTPAQVTGLHVTAKWTGVAVSQLQFTVTNPKGMPLVDQKRRPERPPTKPLETGADVYLYFPDSLADTEVTCQLEGLQADRVVASASFTTRLVRQTIVEADATLEPSLGAKIPGAPCTEGRACESGFCFDGVCCQTECEGTCRSCAVPGKQGTCTLVPEGVPHRGCGDQTSVKKCGFDGTCDGLGTCRLKPAGTLCAPGTCNGNSVVAAQVCDGKGECVMGVAITCAPFGCDPSGPAPHCFTTCTGPAQCVPGRECLNNSCGKRLPGAGCTSAAECVSGFCVDGVCCDSKCDGPCVSCGLVGSAGVCRPVPSGVKDPRGVCADMGAPSCKTSGSCDGAGGCANYVAGTICKAPSCMPGTTTVQITASRCDGSGGCVPGGPLPCAPFACSAGSCRSTCTSNADCAPTIDCVMQSCGKKGLGQACQSGLDCTSTHCVDKVCCEDACQGACRSCALGPVPGKCTPTLAGAPDPRGVCVDMGKSSCGTDGACTGNGACRKYAPGTDCAPGTCNPTTNARTLPATCDPKGACLPGAPISCGAYRCNGPVCFAGCGSDADCLPPNTCRAGACGQSGSGTPCTKDADCSSPFVCVGPVCQLAPAGHACTASNECSTGFCTDGVCCESSNCGPCRSCKLSGSLGICQPLPAGAQCAPASCNGKDRLNPRTCDGMGICQDRGTTDCMPFLCNPATNDCHRSCSGNGQCCCGKSCQGNQCN
jgi:hypothetical protein